MKKTLLKILILCMVICSALCVFTACDDDSPSGSGDSSYNNTYYLYKNSKYDETNYIKLTSGKYERLQTTAGVAMPKISGTYTVTDGTIMFYATEDGETMNVYNGTIKEGVLTLEKSTFNPTVQTFCAKGYTPSGKTDSGNNQNTDSDNNNQTVIYTVTFNSNGGSNVTSQSVAKNGYATKPTNPTKSGYTFVGWYSNSGLTSEWNFNTNTVTSDITLYARWQENLTYYNVTFNSNGGSNVTSQSVAKNGYATKPTNPTKSGYTFVGWYSDSALTTAWDFSTNNVTSNITLYAKWEENVAAYNVTFYLNYTGAGSVTQSTVNGKVNYSPERSGYEFNGWYIDAECTKAYDSNLIVTNNDLVLYAEWVDARIYQGQLSAPVVTINGYIFSWNPITNSAGYDIILKLSGTEIKKETIYSTSWTFPSSLDAGSYTFQIRAKGNGTTTVNSSYASKTFRHKMLGTVTNLKFNLQTSLLTWNAVENASSYSVYNSSTLLTTTTDNSYDMSSFNAGNYTIKITATADGYVSSTATITINKLTLKIPTISVIKNENDLSYTVKWSSINNADIYVVKLGERTVETDSTTYKITADSSLWAGLQTAKVSVAAKNSNADYLISPYSSSTSITQMYTVSVSSSNSSAGNVYIDETSISSKAVEYGASCTIRATTNNGYNFVGWYSGSTFVTNELIYSFTVSNANVMYVAKYNCYTVTASKNISDAGTVNYSVATKVSIGNNVTIQASTNSGYTWLGWYNENNLITEDQIYSFIMPSANIVYTAKWIKVTLTASDTSAGVISQLTGKYKVGDIETITATTNNGYSWLGWYNGNILLTDKLSYTFTMPDINVTYTAKWINSPVTLLKNITDAGVVSISNNQVVGESAIVTAKTNSGYTWLGWYNGNTLLTNELSYTFTMPSVNVVYVAKWSANTDTKYKVEYYTQNIDDDYYTLVKTENLYGITGEQVCANIYNYERFIPVSTNVCGVVNGAGTLVLQVYYDREIYNVYINTLNDNIKLSQTYDNAYRYGKSIPAITATIKNYLGYGDWLGWYNEDNLIDDDKILEGFIVSESVNIVAKCEIDQTLNNLIFISTSTSCTITGVKDKTVKTIIIPDYATAISQGALSGCGMLENLTIPFIPMVYDLNVLGYIFGSDNYNGGEEIEQFYTMTLREFFYIPASLKNVTVKGGIIGHGAFYGCSMIEKITLPMNLQEIGERAFYECQALKSITIPESVTSIGYYAFAYCDSLEEISIPSNVSVIEHYVFDNCASLNTVYWNATNCTSVGSSSHYPIFNNCAELSKIVIANNVTVIPAYSFKGCTSLVEINIPGSVNFIGEYAFLNCYSLADITIGNGVKILGNYSFKDCTALTNIIIPESVTSIGIGAFSGCALIESITIPFVGGSEKTGNDTYQYPFGYIFGTSSYPGGAATTQYYYGGSTISNTNTTYYIPSSLKTATITGGKILCYGAFYNCSTLTSITIPNTLNGVARDVFYGCTSLTKINYTGTLDSWCEILFGGPVLTDFRQLCINNEIVTEANIITATKINDYAFYNCSSLTSVTIGNSVKSIEGYAFVDCSSLTTVNYTGTIDSWCEINFDNEYSNPLYYAHRLYLNNIEVTEPNITIATQINAYTFYNCSYLTSITLSSSITNIGSNAFNGCNNLVRIKYNGEANTWAQINGLANIMVDGRLLYLKEKKVDKVVLDTITEIKPYAFAYQSTIQSIEMSDNVTLISQNAFIGCAIMYATIPCFAIQYIKSEFLKSVILISGSSINDSAFQDCISLMDIEISNSVKTIGTYAFRNCTALKHIFIPNNVQAIGYGAFSGCSNLTDITIPFIGAQASGYTYKYPLGYIFGQTEYNGGVATSQTYLGEIISGALSPVSNTFYIPLSLKTVTVLGGEIFYGAFYGCRNIQFIVLSEGVVGIGEMAFYNCTSLKNINIPNTIQKLNGYETFNNCCSLIGVTFPKDLDICFNVGMFANCYSLVYINVPTKSTAVSSTSPFNGCKRLVEIYNQSSINLVAGTDALGGIARYAKNIYTNSGDSKLLIDDKGFVFYNEETNKILIEYTWDETELVIPNDTTELANFVFYNCYRILSITIPSSVKNIESYAFQGCSCELIWEENSRLTTIGDYAFYGYNGESVLIPNSVTSIGKYAFQGCSCELIWEENSRLTTIGDYAFYGYNGESVLIPNSVTSIGKGAFTSCWSLKNIFLSDNLKTIGAYSFQYCSSLSHITIPENVTNIGMCAFQGCSSLAVIMIGGNVTSIDNWAFGNCSQLNNVVIPDSVIKLGGNVFDNCVSLTCLTIGKKISRLSGTPFNGCTALVNLNYTGTVVQWNNLIKNSYTNTFLNIPATIVHCSDGDVSL